MDEAAEKRTILDLRKTMTSRTCIVAVVGGAFLASTAAQGSETQQYHSSQSEADQSEGSAADASPPVPLSKWEQLEQRLDAQDRRISELEWTVNRQAREIAQRDDELQAKTQEAKELRLALDQQNEGRAVTPPARFQTAQAQLDPPPEPDTAAPEGQTSSAAAEDPQLAQAGRPQSDRAVDQLLLDQGGVLLPEGVFQLEPSIDYTSISSDRVNISGFSIFNAILIGTIRVDDVNRDILTGAVTARYGSGNRTQVDLRIPYVYRNDTETTGIGTGDALERRTTGHGLGDASVTLSWQPLTAKGGRPATIVRVQAEYPTGKSAFEIERVAPTENSPERVLVEAPTGSGFYTFSPGVTFVWPIDPVVLFAGGAYNYTFGRRFREFGFVEPGHGFEFFTGLNMSINERVSMNFSFLDKQRFATSANGLKIPGSGTHDARLSLGASVGLTDKMSLVIASSAGLTDESPDFAFSVRLPITF